MNTQNSKELEKSKGIVAFATNTETTDYIAIANKTLALASSMLGVPYTLISNTGTSDFNSRYDIDTGQVVQWQNFNRYQAYELSPYDTTLVVDVDYLVLDNNLSKIFELDFDYLIKRDSFALTQDWPNIMGPYSLPHVWATVFAFNKTPRAELFFSLVKKVQLNYGYYHSLFNIRERNYRNDYAFAIADIILNGYCVSKAGIPGNMLTIDQKIKSLTLDGNQIIVRDETRAYVLPKTNLHIMSKAYLQSSDFDKFLEQVYNESA